MSAPSLPADHSLEVAQMQQASSDKARQEQDAKDAANKAELSQLRNDSYTGAKGSVNNYFTDQGLVPGDYSNTIDSELSRMLSAIPRDDPNPGTYFSNAGSQIYGTAQDQYRNKESRALDSIFAPNFADSKITNSTDDPILGGILGEQRQSADDIIKNMLSRKVITQTGANAAEADLDKQAPGVRSRLDELGLGQLASGKQTLNDIANKARSSASQLHLGQAFDPYSYGSQSDQAFTDFISGLGDKIRSTVPGNLFSTSGLAAVAGAGSGAQNTAFDPAALSGSTDSTTTPVVKRTGSTVF